MFFTGRLIKWGVWTASAVFFYHYFYVLKQPKPEEAPLAIKPFLDAAQQFDWQIKDIQFLLTKPPVEKLLHDKPPLPPGVPFPKTLVLNLRGTLVCSEYKFG